MANDRKNSQNLILGLAVLAVAALGIYLLLRDKEPPMDQRIVHCYAPLGGNRDLAVKQSTDGKSFTLNIEAGSKVEQAVEPKTLEAFTHCVEVSLNAYGKLPSDMERIPSPQPLGSIIDNWKTEAAASSSHLLVAIDPPFDKNLNNLLVGPELGLRWRVVSQWCSTPPIANCIICSGDVNSDTTSLRISVRPNSSFTKVDYGTAGAAPSSGTPRPPWELVEAGKRYGFDCSLK